MDSASLCFLWVLMHFSEPKCTKQESNRLDKIKAPVHQRDPNSLCSSATRFLCNPEEATKLTLSFGFLLAERVGSAGSQGTTGMNPQSVWKALGYNGDESQHRLRNYEMIQKFTLR